MSQDELKNSYDIFTSNLIAQKAVHTNALNSSFFQATKEIEDAFTTAKNELEFYYQEQLVNLNTETYKTEEEKANEISRLKATYNITTIKLINPFIQGEPATGVEAPIAPVIAAEPEMLPEAMPEAMPVEEVPETVSEDTTAKNQE